MFVTASDRQTATEVAFGMVGETLTFNKFLSERAGYKVYVSENGKVWISDLGNRFEINYENGKTVNVWMD